VRYGTGNANLKEKAKELVDLSPEVILAIAPPSVEALLSVNSQIPTVFAAVTDPVGLGVVQSLAHPGGNATGFLTAEFGFGAKWLELLNEIAPGVRRVVVITEQHNPTATAQFAAIQTVASSSQCGAEASRITGRQRHRARDQRLCKFRQWRPHCIEAFRGDHSSQVDYQNGGAASIARHLPVTHICHRWRFDLVWSGRFRSVSGELPLTLTESSKARNRAICRFKHRRSTN
jgi:hypothetical protein